MGLTSTQRVLLFLVLDAGNIESVELQLRHNVAELSSNKQAQGVD